MTNPSMIKGPGDPGKAASAVEGLSGDEGSPRSREGREHTTPATPSAEAQFPPSEDPLDSNQLKPNINTKHGPGLKRPPGEPA
jgi:hypothetical protein